MTQTTVAVPRSARVAAVLATAPTWTAARRKSDGKPFFFIPSCSSDAVYMTAVDGCTCPAAQNSRTGDCKHQMAVRQHSVTINPASKPRPSYADLFKECATDNCYEIAEFGSFCNRCASDREHAMNREARYAMFGGFQGLGESIPHPTCPRPHYGPEGLSSCVHNSSDYDPALDTDDDAPPF